jgi:hypothetical protein
MRIQVHPPHAHFGYALHLPSFTCRVPSLVLPVILEKGSEKCVGGEGVSHCELAFALLLRTLVPSLTSP